MKAIKDSLKDRIALVTGAGSGIGKAAAKMLSFAGARVAVLGHNREELRVTADQLRRHGEALELEADVTDSASVEAAFAKVAQAWGRLDIVVASAGINGVWAPLEEITPAEWDRTMDVNLRGAFLTLRGAIPLLKQAPRAQGASGGSIVVIASVNGTRMFSNTGATAYACSKAAQAALVKMLAVELGPHRIRVNAVCPGTIETRIGASTEMRHLESVRIPVEYPAGRIPLARSASGAAGEVAELVWFLASDFSSHITGTEVFIDGGQSLLQG